MEKISVAIRVRPSSKSGSPSRKGHKWRVGPHHVALYSTLGTPIGGQNYSFDHVYGTDAKNGDIYEGLTKDVIISCLDGFNGTVFAYGQTSSGKTYTMKGTPTDPGIIRLAVHDVFSHIYQLKSKREFLIRVSYMEIYNEDINDLFAPENRRLRIHENLEKGIFVPGLREEIVDSPQHVFDLLEFGEMHRHFGQTNMNLYSSRSHTIFRMVIESRGTGQDGHDVDASFDAVRVSCLNMVDLAGSERIAKTGAGGVRLKEGTHINKSLMTLGTVINKLSDGGGKHGGHIPYRDSKLTRILQPALGGNAKTAMICTVTPDEIHIDETRGTLQFASRAKRVTTCAQVNEIVTDAALLKRQTKEIEELRMKLQGLPQSADLEKEILNLRNELLKFELEKERLFLELQEEKKAQVERERRIKEQEQKIENLSTLFMSSTLDDRDVEKLTKKVNRRETWCPHQLNTELAVQSPRESCDKVEDDETMDNILYSMRRDRNLTLPPAFEMDDECDPFWTGSNDTDDSEPPTDFENIADEDTWMSLNRGHTTTSTVFCPGFSEKIRSSAGGGAAERVALLENQLKDVQGRYEQLQMSLDVKVQETSENLLEELGRSKLHLEEVQKENLLLKNKLVAQQEMQRKLENAVQDLEIEVDATRLLTCSMQGVLAESLHVQANVSVAIQDCIEMVTTKGKSTSAVCCGSLGPKAKEKHFIVERSVQQCREICEGIDLFLRDRPCLEVRMLETASSILEADPKLRSSNSHDDVDGLDVRHPTHYPKVGDMQEEEVSGASALSNPLEASAPTRGPKYCEDCCLSPLSMPTAWCTEPAVSCEDSEQLSCEGICVDETIGGKMPSLPKSKELLCHERLESLSQCQAPVEFLYDSPGCASSNRFSAYALRALAAPLLDTKLDEKNATDFPDVGGLSNGFISCDHVGCSFGDLGRNCHKCLHRGRETIWENEIATAVSNLCRLVLKLLEPSFSVLDSVKVMHNRGGSREQSNGKLKAHLANAKLLATWLLEEVQVILHHDLDCLKCHVKERGSVGLLLEALQVLLLHNANLGVGLLQATCQDRVLLEDLLQQLSGSKDLQNNDIQSVVKKVEVDSVAESFQQAETTNEANAQSICDEDDKQELTCIDGESEVSSSILLERVLEVEGVEEMLGKVLAYSMGLLLSKEHRVMEGGTMLIVLTSGLEVCPAAGYEVSHGNVAAETPPQVHSSTTATTLPCVAVDTSASEAQQDEQTQMSRFVDNQECYATPARELVKSSNSVRQFLKSSMEHLYSGRLDRAGLRMYPSNRGPLQRTCCLVDVFFYEDEACSERSWDGSVDKILGTKENDTTQLVIEMKRVRQLEVSLAAAELEVVELKIELEDLRATVQTYDDISQDDGLHQLHQELQAYRNKCENYEEEIRLILEQIPSPAENLKKERQLMEIVQENQFLQGCLATAKKHVLRSKAWRDEIRKRRAAQDTRQEVASQTEVSLREDSPSADGKIRAIINKRVDGNQTMYFKPTTSAERIEGNVHDVHPRRVRGALEVLDLNVLNSRDNFAPKKSKRRRQLQFRDENFDSERPNP